MIERLGADLVTNGVQAFLGQGVFFNEELFSERRFTMKVNRLSGKGTSLSVAALMLFIVVLMGTGSVYSQSCSNVAGTWYVDAYVDATNCGEGIYYDTGVYYVTQNGCNISVEAEEGTFYGTVTGNTMTWTGSYPSEGGTVTSTITLVATGDYLTGSESWTWSGFGERCSGTSDIEGWRESGGGSEGDCATVSDDLTITIPCIYYNGSPLDIEVILVPYRNPEDPFGFYWQLGAIY
ncbi:MAG: hypothetical protein DRG83_16685 [Deltaproteobacteria bacterium]|nr:MAG: hypothetical protein DRG83_16685 [Deltaproteobacteria bacterium]